MANIKISYCITGLSSIDKTAPERLTVDTGISIPEGIEFSGFLDVLKSVLQDRRTEELIGSLSGIEITSTISGSPCVPEKSERIPFGKEILKFYRALQYKLGC